MNNYTNSGPASNKETIPITIRIALVYTIFIISMSGLNASGQNDINPYRASTLKKNIFPKRISCKL